MFDERSDKWIRIYKVYTVVMFWLYAAAAVVMCILGFCDVLWWISPFLDGIICLAGGLLIAYSQLIVNMLVIQLLNNVQTIRETLSKQGNNQNDNTKLEELKKFKKLLDMNVITAEEYETKKAQLLEQI